MSRLGAVVAVALLAAPVAAQEREFAPMPVEGTPPAGPGRLLPVSEGTRDIWAGLGLGASQLSIPHRHALHPVGVGIVRRPNYDDLFHEGYGLSVVAPAGFQLEAYRPKPGKVGDAEVVASPFFGLGVDRFEGRRGAAVPWGRLSPESFTIARAVTGLEMVGRFGAPHYPVRFACGGRAAGGVAWLGAVAGLLEGPGGSADVDVYDSALRGVVEFGVWAGLDIRMGSRLLLGLRVEAGARYTGAPEPGERDPATGFETDRPDPFASVYVGLRVGVDFLITRRLRADALAVD